MKLDEFTKQYIETALWSSVNDEGRPLDDWATINHLSPIALSQMVEDCMEFQLENWDDIEEDVGRAGHDFWLTRNGHVAGFLDGDWPEPQASRLTENSKLYGEQHLFVGCDNIIHIM